MGKRGALSCQILRHEELVERVDGTPDMPLPVVDPDRAVPWQERIEGESVKTGDTVGGAADVAVVDVLQDDPATGEDGVTGKERPGRRTT